MNKKEQLRNLAVFIGLRAAHEILVLHTKREESIPHLEREADTYRDLGLDLAEGNWNRRDIERIKEIAKKRCGKKLEKYKDLGPEKYRKVENTIDDIMRDLGLV